VNPNARQAAAKGLPVPDRTYHRIEGHHHPYVCSVTRKPRLSSRELFDRHRDRERLALDQRIDVLRRPIADQERGPVLAFKAAAPPVVHEAFNGRWHRQQQRAARKVGNARKARRGWR
jgi:hypothetical protein